MKESGSKCNQPYFSTRRTFVPEWLQMQPTLNFSLPLFLFPSFQNVLSCLIFCYIMKTIKENIILMQNTTNFNNFAVWADGNEEKLQTASNIFKGSFSNGDYLITAAQNAFFNQLSLVTVSLAHAISAPAWANNLNFNTYKTSFKSAFETAVNNKMKTDGTSAFATVIGDSTANLNYTQLKDRVDIVDAMKSSFYLVTATGTFNGSDIVITDDVANVATRKANGYANAVLELVVNDSVIVTSGLYISSTSIAENDNHYGSITIKALNGMPSSGDYTIKIKVSDYSFRG